MVCCFLHPVRWNVKKMSSVFQKHVQKNPVRDYSLVEKDNNVSLRMPLGMRTNTKLGCIPNGMLRVVFEHFFYRAIIPNGIKKGTNFFSQSMHYGIQFKKTKE